MDVTTKNFNHLLPEIIETIKTCDFIAIDTELSGLMRERIQNIFDLPAERFAKAVESSRGYFIMQFGLSCFTLCDEHHYTNRTYNFYIFPQASNCYGDKDRTFSIQAHAIQFLTEHGFDFNKLFKEGVSYLTFQEKKNLTAQLKSETKNREKVKVNSNGLPDFVPVILADKCRSWLKTVEQFLKKHGQTSNSDDLELKDCSTAHKRAIMKRILECQPFSNSIMTSVKYDPVKNESFLVVSYIDPLVKEEKQKNDLISAKGFLEVLEHIILNKKPIVGHNLALDLIQIINQFMETLSDDYNSFKEICHSLFPLIYDTKFVAHNLIDPKTLTNNQSRLSDLYQQLRDSDTMTRIEVEHLGELFHRKQLPHQAGFDAYMSGYCFLALCQSYLDEKRKYKFKKEKSESKRVSIVKDNQIIQDLSNKIHFSYSYDFKYYDLCGEELEPIRTHVFYLEHPNTWVLDDIFRVFQEFGGVSVGKLSKTSALCALRNVENAKLVRKKVKELETSKSNHKIYTYEKYIESFKPKKRKDTCDDEDIEFFDAE